MTAGTAVTGALDQLVEALAETAMYQADPPASLRYLAECQLCRNHLLYLLDTPRPSHATRLALRARLRALPEVHALSHGSPDSPDSNPPQIRGLA